MDAARPQLIAFSDGILVAQGDFSDAVAAAKSFIDDADGTSAVLIFDAETSEPVEIDFRGTLADVAVRYRPRPEPGEPPAPRAPGRPKLGVVSREVTLLPRHWEWLASQPGSASVTLRKLVEHARRDGSAADRRRRAQDSAYRFMLAVAGDEPGFEEATRALYAGDAERFACLTAPWPADVSAHAGALAVGAFSAEALSAGER